MPGQPHELESLWRLRIQTVLQAGARISHTMPCELLGALVLLLGSKGRNSTRQDDTTRLRTNDELLRSAVLRWGNLPATASATVVSARIPSFLKAIYERHEACLRDCMGEWQTYEDALTLIQGRDSEVATTLWRQLYQQFDPYPILSAFKPVVVGPSDMRQQFTRLFSTFASDVRTEAVMEAADELERKLKERSPICFALLHPCIVSTLCKCTLSRLLESADLDSLYRMRFC